MSKKNKKSSETFIRSTKHYFLRDCNAGKSAIIAEFLDEYRKACQNYIDYIWSHPIMDETNNLVFDITQDILNLPQYLDYQIISFPTKLSARALSAAVTQASGIVRGAVAIRRKILYIIQKRTEENLDTDYYQKKLEKQKLVKPILNSEKFQAELSSKNIDFRLEKDKHFNLFIRLKSTGFDLINIPIKFHQQDQKWMQKEKSKLLAGILISKNCIQLRYQITQEKKTTGEVVGADTGMKAIISLSNEISSPQTDLHGHSLQSICKKLARKKKGGLAFQAAAAHRDNFINWSINQLNVSDILQINLEEVNNIFYGRRTSRFISGWTNSKIEDKVKRFSEENGVRFSLKSSIYKSQRCSGCAVVCKKFRKGKIYHCQHCGLHLDADLNAAKNNEIELPNIPKWLRQMKLNKSGFLWKPDGFFDLSGQELRVPDTEK